jgi:hypothetical protein
MGTTNAEVIRCLRNVRSEDLTRVLRMVLFLVFRDIKCKECATNFIDGDKRIRYGLSDRLKVLKLDLFRNSTPSSNCCVAPVLRSSYT